MKKGILTILHFLRLIDADKKLSLSNIAVIVVIVKMALSKDATAPVDVGALITSLMSYQAAKIIRKS